MFKDFEEYIPHPFSHYKEVETFRSYFYHMILKNHSEIESLLNGIAFESHGLLSIKYVTDNWKFSPNILPLNTSIFMGASNYRTLTSKFGFTPKDNFDKYVKWNEVGLRAFIYTDDQWNMYGIRVGDSNTKPE